MTNWIQNYLTQNESLAALRVARRSRYSLHLRRGRRERLALVSGAPIHYFTSGAWQPLDTRLRPRRDGRLGAPGLAFSLDAGGDVRVQGGHHRHKTVGVGIYADGVYKGNNLLSRGEIARRSSHTPGRPLSQGEPFSP